MNILQVREQWSYKVSIYFETCPACDQSGVLVEAAEKWNRDHKVVAHYEKMRESEQELVLYYECQWCGAEFKGYPHRQKDRLFLIP